jgi:conjugative transfer region lipoprotein (TIGR03751 family)
MQIAVLVGAAILAGCNASSTIHDPTYTDMRAIYDEETGANGKGVTGFDAAREAVKRSYCPSPWERDYSAYSRTAQNEIDFLFTRLPNPVIYMYIDPHLTGDEGIPVPGYTTAFPMYDREHWALPDESPAPVGTTYPILHKEH